MAGRKKQRKERSSFNPNRDEVQKAVEAWLAQGNTITKIIPEPSDFVCIDEFNGMTMTNERQAIDDII